MGMDVNAVARRGLPLVGALRQPACGVHKHRCLAATRDPSLLTFNRAATHWYGMRATSAAPRNPAIGPARSPATECPLWGRDRELTGYLPPTAYAALLSPRSARRRSAEDQERVLCLMPRPVVC